MEAYLSALVVLVMYVGYKLAFRTKIVRASEIDVMTGRREMDLERIVAEERAEKMGWSIWKRGWKVLC